MSTGRTTRHRPCCRKCESILPFFSAACRQSGDPYDTSNVSRSSMDVNFWRQLRQHKVAYCIRSSQFCRSRYVGYMFSSRLHCALRSRFLGFTSFNPNITLENRQVNNISSYKKKYSEEKNRNTLTRLFHKAPRSRRSPAKNWRHL